MGSNPAVSAVTKPGRIITLILPGFSMPFFFPKNKVCACRTLAPQRYAKHYVPHRELHIPAERFCVIGTKFPIT